MYKRFELHNHTVESDGSISCDELVEHMLSEQVDVFAITDHNTVSGHRKIYNRLKEQKDAIECIYGMEYTTYYGHILCFNLKEYVPWENINRHKPELLFRAVKAKGAIPGIAHPFSYGDPFARGCRFEMTFSDYSDVDFIEIINNRETYEHNQCALELWEHLLFAGYRVAATSGMDLHGKWSFVDQYETFVEGTDGGDVSAELADAIHNCRTWVSKGPLLIASQTEDESAYEFHVEKSNKVGAVYFEVYQILLRMASGSKVFAIKLGESIRVSKEELENADIIIPQLYGETLEMKDLQCVSQVIFG